MPRDIIICLCDDYCSGQKGKAHSSSLERRLEKGVATSADKGAAEDPSPCICVGGI